MEMGEVPSREGVTARIEEFGQRVLQDPELTRRAFLGLAALTTLEAGVAAAQLKSGWILNERQELEALCGEDIRCYLEDAGLEHKVPDEFITPSSIESPTTLLPPPPETTTTLPPTTLPPVTMPPPIETVAATELGPAPPRSMHYGEFADNHEHILSLIPRLEQLNAMYPNVPLWQQVERQKQHIEMLRQNIITSADEYNQFVFNTDFSGIFAGRNGFDFQAVLHHWTGAPHDYVDVPHFAQSMAGRASVQLYAHKDDNMYLLTPEVNRQAGHAAELNPFTLGIEYYTGPYDGVNSPIFSYTPARCKTSIYATVHILRHFGKPVGPATILGHYAGDLIVQNPYYNPYEGTFHQIDGYQFATIRKQDPPQEYIDMIVSKAMELNAMLG